MKKKSFSAKKLSLQKKTVASLDRNAIKGGTNSGVGPSCDPLDCPPNPYPAPDPIPDPGPGPGDSAPNYTRCITNFLSCHRQDCEAPAPNNLF